MVGGVEVTYTTTIVELNGIDNNIELARAAEEPRPRLHTTIVVKMDRIAPTSEKLLESQGRDCPKLLLSEPCVVVTHGYNLCHENS